MSVQLVELVALWGRPTL